MFVSKAMQTGTAEAVFAFNQKPQRDRQFSESLLVSFNRHQARDQVAFAVSSATSKKFSVSNRRRKWTHRPFAQVTYRLHVVVAINDKALRAAATFAVNYRIP